MPWSAPDAESHDKKADTPKKRRLWAQVANGELARTGDDGKAAKIANGVLKRAAERGKRG